MIDETEDLAQIEDPIQRVRRVNELIDEHQAAVIELSRTRREILDELVAKGWKPYQIADALAISRTRISQLLAAGVRPERALLGSGSLIAAIGGKHEVGRADGQPLAMVSAEALAAYERLAELARSLTLGIEYEVVPPPGMVNLNRPNLIVLTSPRLLPFVGQVLESDPHLGFAVDEDKRWYLVDKTTSTEYRSAYDAGKPGDYAYIGRLPRPDGRGTFLYLAGIHGPGTAGAAHYVEGHLAELYREVKTRRWSALVSCEFDPDTRHVRSSQLVTPIYRHDGA